jgi:hypothetical protein
LREGEFDEVIPLGLHIQKGRGDEDSDLAIH